MAVRQYDLMVMTPFYKVLRVRARNKQEAAQMLFYANDDDMEVIVGDGNPGDEKVVGVKRAGEPWPWEPEATY